VITQQIKKSFENKKVLVTGGTGLIGRQIVDLLLGFGSFVKTVSLDQLNLWNDVDHHIGDLTDFNYVKEITKDVDFVFHVAGIKGSVVVTEKKPANFFVPMLMMNSNVLEACRINHVSKIVYTSSIGAYAQNSILKEVHYEEEEKPMDSFPGWAKRMAEKQIQSYKIQYGLTNFAVVRLCNVYGPGDNFNTESGMVIPSLMSRIFLRQEDPILIWGDGSAIRDFAFSKDVAEGIILAMFYGINGNYINLSSGYGVSIKELVETLNQIVDFDYKFDDTKPSGFPKRIMDISLAKDKLGFDPKTNLKEGLSITWKWFKKHHKEHIKKIDYFK